LTSREIADRLGVGERTVETHVDHIRAKLGVRSRAQIAAWAVERGWHRPRRSLAQTRLRAVPKKSGQVRMVRPARMATVATSHTSIAKSIRRFIRCPALASCTGPRAPIAALLLVGSTAAATPAFADGGFLTLTGGSVTEGDSGQIQAVFSVSLTSPQSTPVTARFQAIANHTTIQTGDATAGSGCSGEVDFVSVDGTVTVPANTTQVSVNVPVCGDLAIEGTETFTAMLSNVQAVSASSCALPTARSPTTIRLNRFRS